LKQNKYATLKPTGTTTKAKHVSPVSDPEPITIHITVGDTNILTPLAQKNMNKNSHPSPPFTHWEEDGALFPPKPKLFSDRRSPSKKLPKS